MENNAESSEQETLYLLETETDNECGNGILQEQRNKPFLKKDLY